MNTTLNLAVNQSEKLVYVAQLSHNEKWELFFRPLWNQNKNSFFYDGLDNSERDIQKIDHFSFHEDGTIHLIMKDISGNRDVLFHQKLSNTISTMPKDRYGALLIYSIYDFSLVKRYMSKPSHLTFSNSKNVDMQFEIQGNDNQFSLVLFLLGENIDVKRMLLSHFPSIFIPGNSICIGDFLVNRNNQSPRLQLLVAYTNKVIHPPHPNALASSQKYKQASRVENPIGIRLACSDEGIRQMI